MKEKKVKSANVCICCSIELVQDIIPTNMDNVVQYTRYYYCNHKSCLRYRLLVLPVEV